MALQFSLERQIACVRREIGIRERVYKRWVQRGKMRPEVASDERAVMESVLDTLVALKAARESAARVSDANAGQAEALR